MSAGLKQILSPFTGRKKRKAWNKTREKYIPEEGIDHFLRYDHLDHISKKLSFPWRLWDVSKISLASIFGFSKIPHKNDFVWFP